MGGFCADTVIPSSVTIRNLWVDCRLTRIAPDGGWCNSEPPLVNAIRSQSGSRVVAQCLVICRGHARIALFEWGDELQRFVPVRVLLQALSHRAIHESARRRVSVPSYRERSMSQMLLIGSSRRLGDLNP